MTTIPLYIQEILKNSKNWPDSDILDLDKVEKDLNNPNAIFLGDEKNLCDIFEV